jgi:DNA mismatch repair ATPase MutS
MKVHLLYRDRDFDWQTALQAAAAREEAHSGRRDRSKHRERSPELPWNAETLIRDLELDTLFAAMAGNDELVLEVAKSVILNGTNKDPAIIRYRQNVLQDCLQHPAVIRKLYAVAAEAVEKKNKQYLGAALRRLPDWLLRDSIELLENLLDSIGELRKISDSYADKFTAEGWTAFFSIIRAELSDKHIACIEYHLSRLKLRNGLVLSVRLGKGNKGTDYVLHLPPARKGTWLKRLIAKWRKRFFARQQQDAYSFSLSPRDESGARILSDLKNRGIGIAADALGQSADHVRNFFSALRVELAFYVGCINLHEQLMRKGELFSPPSPMPAEECRLSFRGLYDVCLALRLNRCVIGNDANADAKNLLIVTGANQGGKSTFLRSVGLAQLLMQCGMFVPAESFCSSVCSNILTHYKREEDADMKSGKLDEELDRMSAIVDHIRPYSMILFNESFAATNEREGAEIAQQIISALSEKRIRMVFVTHLYEFARSVYEKHGGNVLFLRAERQVDGTRTFRLIEGEPLQTSFGEDLYKRIFAVTPRLNR